MIQTYQLLNINYFRQQNLSVNEHIELSPSLVTLGRPDCPQPFCLASFEHLRSNIEACSIIINVRLEAHLILIQSCMYDFVRICKDIVWGTIKVQEVPLSIGRVGQ